MLTKFHYRFILQHSVKIASYVNPIFKNAAAYDRLLLI